MVVARPSTHTPAYGSDTDLNGLGPPSSCLAHDQVVHTGAAIRNWNTPDFTRSNNLCQRVSSRKS
eukprot:4422817-Amphidinium_carterae.1